MISIITIIVILLTMSYLFGFWDHMADKAGVSVSVVMGIMVLQIVLAIGGVVLAYVVLAYCHKWIGPYIFGG